MYNCGKDFNSMLNYSDIKNAARENKTILVKQGSTSSYFIPDALRALDRDKYINNFKIRHCGLGVYQAISGEGEICGVKIQITDRIEEEFVLK